MAVNVSVYDLVNYPDNSKTVTVDIRQVTPIGYEGDEQWVVSCTTTAYSDNTNRTAIADIYIQNQRSGWAKSMIVNGPFTIVSGSNQEFKIKMDADPTWRTVNITADTYSGDSLAEHLEEEIRALNDSVSATYQLAYMNASVEYEDGRFKIVSGSVSNRYTGTNRSSVVVDSTANSAHYLGLDFPMTSIMLAGFEAKEGRVDTSYTAGATTLNVKEYTWSDAATVSGSVFAITSDNSSWEYFLCTGGTVSALTIAGLHGSGGLVNSYNDNDKIVMFNGPQDPEATPSPWYDDLDGIVRWGVKTLSNQIDYSS